MKTLPALAFAFATLVAAPSFAEDTIASSIDNSFWVAGSVGLMDITAREYVNVGGFKLSQLDWETRNAVVYSAVVGAELSHEWTVKARLDYANGGDNHMTDYDWVPPFIPDNSKDGWSERSIHPDTDLRYYFSGTLELQRQLAATDTTRVGLTAGLKYSDVKWDAHGGSYIYSTSAPRDTVGSFPSGQKVISYRQQIPSAFIGFNGSSTFDRLTLSGGAKGGLTFGINDTDDHWLRSTRFKGDMDIAPMVMFDVAVNYRITDSASFYVSGEFENIFRAEGGLGSHNRLTGVSNYNRDTAGASFQAMSLKFGLKGTF